MNQSEESINYKYIQKTLSGGLKGLISLIPYIGSPVVGAWDGYYCSRFEDIINQLSLSLQKLGEEKVDIEYVKSEEFIDLLQKSIKIRLLSRSKQKAQFILGLLTESMRRDRNVHFSAAIKESFLLVLEQLSEDEMVFLHDFSQGKFREKSKDNIYQMGACESVAIDTLLAKGILREDNTWVKHIVESMFGREFIAYLKLLAEEERDSEAREFARLQDSCVDQDLVHKECDYESRSNHYRI